MVESGAGDGGTSPVLSVIVTIVDGGDVLRRCLEALSRQETPPTMEILVPFDASIASETLGIGREFPIATLLDIGELRSERPVATAAGQHEMYDRRRAAGLATASGEIVAILEDRAPPRLDWARRVTELHALPFGVIGGAIETTADDPLRLASYLCDFSRYSLPFESGPVSWVSDVNVSYKRRVLDETRNLWKERYQEPIVHWALLERGETLYLSSELVVEHCRPPTTLKVLLPERFHWGRLFGHIRARRLSSPQRLAYAALGPLLPVVLLLRHGRTQLRRGQFRRFLRSAPVMILLLVAWTTGEISGCLTKPA